MQNNIADHFGPAIFNLFYRPFFEYFPDFIAFALVVEQVFDRPSTLKLFSHTHRSHSIIHLMKQIL